MNLKIGSLSLQNPLILAPMAGVTDLPFRRVCRQMGAALVSTEMISAVGLVLGIQSTERLLTSDGTDRPLSAQLFGADPDRMARAASICQEKGADIVDINMGCPAPKVVRKGAGAALLLDLAAAARIIEAVRKALTIPLTVKMRSGWKGARVVAIELARIAEDCGVDAVVLHPRTRAQGYGVPADWELIGRLREGVSIPVIGNGDVFTPEHVVALQEETGCHGIMVGRAARGNPWIFGRSLALIEGRPLPPAPGPREIWRVVVEHLAAIRLHYDSPKVLHVAKAHLLSYTRGLPGSAQLRSRAIQARDLPSFERLLLSYFCTLQRRMGRNPWDSTETLVS